MDYSIGITRGENGFILTTTTQLDDNSHETTSEVFEDGAFLEDLKYVLPDDVNVYTEIDSKEISMYYLIHAIRDHFDVRYNKHKKVNLVVEFQQE